MADNISRRLYSYDDMVRVSSPACRGCGKCCIDMGDSILLDPLDVCMLTQRYNKYFDEMIGSGISLHIEDGIILPHLEMRETDKACYFLGSDRECTIHSIRPGLCRLFPLGRQYTENGFSYFIVDGACSMPSKSKVRISDWLGISDHAAYADFVTEWHNFVKKAKTAALAAEDPSYRSSLSSFILKVFYQTPYPGGICQSAETVPDLSAFYATFKTRLSAACEAVS